MPEKLSIAEKIYEALKKRAGEAKEITIHQGISTACMNTNMLPASVVSWLDVMTTEGWIQMDGATIWLTKDYGPRLQGVSPEEQKILDAYKVPEKALQKFKKKDRELTRRLKIKTAKGDKKT